MAQAAGPAHPRVPALRPGVDRHGRRRAPAWRGFRWCRCRSSSVRRPRRPGRSRPPRSARGGLKGADPRTGSGRRNPRSPGSPRPSRSPGAAGAVYVTTQRRAEAGRGVPAGRIAVRRADHQSNAAAPAARRRPARRRARARAPAALPPAVKSPKKGVSTNGKVTFNQAAVKDMKAGWYYNWSPSPTLRRAGRGRVRADDLGHGNASPTPTWPRPRANGQGAARLQRAGPRRAVEHEPSSRPWTCGRKLAGDRAAPGQPVGRLRRRHRRRLARPVHDRRRSSAATGSTSSRCTGTAATSAPARGRTSSSATCRTSTTGTTCPSG